MKSVPFVYRILLVMIFVCLVACDARQQEAASIDSSASRAVVAVVDTPPKITEISCQLLASFPRSLELIPQYSGRIYGGASDSCMQGLLDSVVAGMTSTEDTLYFVAFDALSRNADGWVGEYMGVLHLRLLENMSLRYLDYLYTTGSNGEAIGSLRREIELRKESDVAFAARMDQLRDRFDRLIVERPEPMRVSLRSLLFTE